MAQEMTEIIVDQGVYAPAHIKARLGEPIVLRFIRRTANPCAKVVVFADLAVSAELPLGEPVELTLTPQRAGEYPFTCEMGMYRGVLIVSKG